MIRYYCSGFDINNAFGHGLGAMLKKELKETKNILYIPAGTGKQEKARNKYVPIFTNHFKNIDIIFDNINILTQDTLIEEAKNLVKNADFIMLMGGDPYNQKELCQRLDIINDLKEYKGIMLGYSAGAMLMSKYIIITPCSEEYPDFHIEEGLNLDGISVYPHNNTTTEIYPNTLTIGDETYYKKDLIEVAREYEAFYLLQDNLKENGQTDVSIIKSNNGTIEFYYENEGKIWLVEEDIKLLKRKY